jgi:hypothetical protein
VIGSEYLLPPVKQGKFCRFLNMNALLAQVVHREMGYETQEVNTNDGLHYFHASHVWTDYLINTIVDNAI